MSVCWKIEGKILGALRAVFLASATFAIAGASSCPSGSESLGFKRVIAWIHFPHEAKLNLSDMVWQFPLRPLQSKQQVSGRFSGGAAIGVMTAKDVPKGFAIIASGSENATCKGWAIHKPAISTKGSQQLLRIKAYCHSGSGSCTNVNSDLMNECNVDVELCRYVQK